MRRLFTIFTLLLLAQSCAKETDVSLRGDTSSDVVSFTASVVEMTATKATLINSWSGGEEVALFVDGDDAVYHFTIAEDGTMSGGDVIVDRTVENTYTAFYPYDATLSSIEEYKAACTAGNVDYMRATTTISGADVTLQFSHSMAALSFSIMIGEVITSPSISLAVDGNFESATTLDLDATIGSVASLLKASYFVAAGTDISAAVIKVEQSGSATLHSIAREDTNTLEQGKIYPFSCNIGDIPTGSGSSSDPYVVYTADDMRNVGTGTDGWNMNSHYILAWDIDLEEVEFTAIGTDASPFTGSLNGAGYEVEGLYIDQSSSQYQALFGYIEGATITNLGVSGSVSGSEYVGTIVGYADSSTVSCCYSIGSVVGSDDSVGGIMGYADESSTVSYCYNASSVVGSDDRIGGIVGYNWSGTVTACYNTGSIKGSSSSTSVGGIVGYNYDSSNKVLSCYNVGSVWAARYFGGIVGYNRSSKVISCYYLSTDYDVVGVGYNYIGTVTDVVIKTESEMKSTDFVDLLNDGGTSWMSDYATPINDGYPILSWQTSNN